jgi:hypothetical protein
MCNKGLIAHLLSAHHLLSSLALSAKQQPISTAVIGAELTAEQQPISTTVSSALYSAFIGALLTAEQQPISTTVRRAHCPAVSGAELTAQQQPSRCRHISHFEFAPSHPERTSALINMR